MASNSMETPSQRRVTQGPHSTPSGPEQQNARASHQDRGAPSIITTTGTTTITVRTATTAAASTPGATDDNDTYSGHNCNVPSGSAVQTNCASTRRQLHQPQHSTRTALTLPTTRHRPQQARHPQPRSKRSSSNKTNSLLIKKMKK